MIMLENISIWRIFGSRRRNLSNYFDSIEVREVLPRLLSYLHETTKTQNVIWLEKSEFDRLKKCADAGVQPESTQDFNRDLQLQSTRGHDEAYILKILKSFAAQGLNTELQNIEGQPYGLVPVFLPMSKAVGAYILLCGLPGARPARTLAEASADLHFMSKHIEFTLQHWRSQKNSFLDDLTSLYNQTYLNMVLDNEIQRAQRANEEFTVLFMDIDYFKSINDKNGHWIGSRLLIELGNIFKNNIRRSDYGFRYGGDEFVIVLPATSAEKAVIVAERLRHVVEQTDFIIDGVSLRLTMSVGLASFPEHAKTYKDIIKMADEAMYSGKHKSRNIVFVAS